MENCASRLPGAERHKLTFPFFRAPKAGLWDNREPIREELFSAERLEAHARSLAAAQPVSQRQVRGLKLADRLADNAASLRLAYRAMAKAIGEGRAITPAAEWLVDNYHLVEKQIREIRADLPAGYYRQLPKLTAGPFIGYPRIFGVAWAFVAHTDSHFDSTMLLRYVQAYQSVQPLTIGELWALPVTLRIVLIENLRRVAEQMVGNRAARQAADELADRLLGVGGRKPEPAALVFAQHEQARLADAFAVQLVHRLRDQDPRITPALTWLDQRLAAQNMTADDIVREVHRRQGATNVTVRNIITSLRLIGDVDWPDSRRAAQPGRYRARRWQRVSGHGFSHTQPLPQRHRATGARYRPHGIRCRAGRHAGGGARKRAGRTSRATICWATDGTPLRAALACA